MGELLDWRNTRVLVTGAGGFIGKHLIKRLRALEAETYAATGPISSNSPVSCDPLWESPWLVFDVCERESVQAAVDAVTPDVVFHLAAVGVTHSVSDAMRVLTVNAGGAVNLLEALRGSGVQKVVLVGTSHEYGPQEAMERLDPFSAYAASKVAAWAFGRMYWRAHKLPVVTVRPFHVYGPGQAERALIPAAVWAGLGGEDFAMTRGEQERDFVHVKDIVAGMTAVAETPGIEGESVDLGTGIGHLVREAVDRIWSMTKARGEVQAGRLPYRAGEPMSLIADADRAEALTGWRAAVPFEEGLSGLVQILMRRSGFNDA